MRESLIFANLVLLIAMPVAGLVGVRPALGEEVPTFLEVESFRSTSHPIPIKAVDSDATCKAMPVVDEAGSAPLRIRIACGSSLTAHIEWSALDAHEFALERVPGATTQGQLLLSANGSVYRVRASFFRLSDRVAAIPPACSSLGEQRRRMAATQGSAPTWCRDGK